ncbi:hypothetical protein TEA_015658 [Camellia sinensis var. sinensis]|uniref:MAPK kinase substrate protein n=1 Tax=Camellia sinensis var. sinensis TaxID=542762 RepID=A0A4V3WP21_CAMSN|nr:hypothetical protein TEA_015658 [Camellia sinensis var. sinensis]
MDGLQRSAISFRRQGSSGLVWDDKFLSGKLNQTKPKDHQQADEGKRDHRASQMQRSRSNREHTYHTVKDVGPTINPPSPKLSACGFCGMLGNPQTTPKLRSTKQEIHRGLLSAIIVVCCFLWAEEIHRGYLFSHTMHAVCFCCLFLLFVCGMVELLIGGVNNSDNDEDDDEDNEDTEEDVDAITTTTSTPPLHKKKTPAISPNPFGSSTLFPVKGTPTSVMIYSSLDSSSEEEEEDEDENEVTIMDFKVFMVLCFV